MERQQSNTLHTPNISNSLSTGDVKFTSGDLRDLSAVLKNCPEVNQLWENSSDLWKKIGTSVIKQESRGEKSKTKEY